MKLQSANGRLETNQQVGTGFVCRRMIPLSASITCTHMNTQLLSPSLSSSPSLYFSPYQLA